jgi:FkbM family methyltransferase
MNLKYYEFIAERIHPAELVVFVKKLMRIRRRYFAFNNLKLYIDPVSHFGLRILRDKAYEPQVTSFVEQLLLPGDVFIDLGANEGYFSVIASKLVGDAGKVFCIEPQRRLWPVLFDNFIANECHNVQLLPYAIGPEKGEAELILTPSINTGSSQIRKSVRTTFWERQKIKIYPLDSIVALYGIGEIKLMKIDIEGYELYALKSALKTLKKGAVKNIVIEFHPVQLKEFNQTVEETIAFLHQMGYRRSDTNEELFSLQEL